MTRNQTSLKRHDAICERFNCPNRLNRLKTYPSGSYCGIACAKIHCMHQVCQTCAAMLYVPHDCLFITEYTLISQGTTTMTIPRNETVCAWSNCKEHRPDSLYARCALYCREMSTTDCIKTRCQ